MDFEKNFSFGEDIEFLNEHVSSVKIISNASGKAKVAVVPDYQGRVMTSSLAGDKGDSFGWLNYKHIASGKFVPHINVFGGEDRFWMGPEGGQYAIFFKKGDSFDLEHWQTPSVIDTEKYDIVSSTTDSVTFKKTGTVTNMAGNLFQLEIQRTIRILEKHQIENILGICLPDNLPFVAYESDNTLINIGDNQWTKDTGLLSIWILGMYKPTDDTVIIIPFKEGNEEELGEKVNDAYFGKVPPDRLIVKDNVLFFKGDGKHRAKIGISPRRALPILGSYSSSMNLLTLVSYTKPENCFDYINSMWEYQKDPYNGDVVNSYNDGPVESGEQLGPFYELETSSPAAALGPGEKINHCHRTMHFQTDKNSLNILAENLLNTNLDEIPYY